MPELEKDSFLGHLEALRATLLACVRAWALAVPFGIVLAPRFIRALMHWSFPESFRQLNYFGILEVFVVYMRMGLILAVVFASPYIIFKIWRFLLPALYENERRLFKRWLVFAAILFVAGAAFCVVAILPLIVRFSAAFASDYLTPVLGLSNFLSLSGALILACGAMFQMPVAIFIAVRFGLVRVESLRHGRPYALIIILVIAAILTPPDVISQLLLALPTLLLYELGIILASSAAPPIEEAPWQGPDPASSETQAVAPVAMPSQEAGESSPDDTMYDFYKKEAARTDSDDNK